MLTKKLTNSLGNIADIDSDFPSTIPRSSSEQEFSAVAEKVNGIETIGLRRTNAVKSKNYRMSEYLQRNDGNILKVGDNSAPHGHHSSSANQLSAARAIGKFANQIKIIIDRNDSDGTYTYSEEIISTDYNAQVFSKPNKEILSNSPKGSLITEALGNQKNMFDALLDFSLGQNKRNDLESNEGYDKTNVNPDISDDTTKDGESNKVNGAVLKSSKNAKNPKIANRPRERNVFYIPDETDSSEMATPTESQRSSQSLESFEVQPKTVESVDHSPKSNRHDTTPNERKTSDRSLFGFFLGNIFTNTKPESGEGRRSSMADLKDLFEKSFPSKSNLSEYGEDNGAKRWSQSPSASQSNFLESVQNLVFKTELMQTFLKVPDDNKLIQLWDRIKDVAELGSAESLLSDAVFSLYSVLGSDPDTPWTVIYPGKRREERNRIGVTLGQMRSHLKDAFQMSTDKFEEIVDIVHTKEASKLVLCLQIAEANNLRAKTVRGGSNPFVIASTSGVTDSCRTRSDRETLNPKWMQDFKIKIRNINHDHLKLEVWHDFEPNMTNEVTGVKNLKAFSRLMKETTALVHKQDGHLLGTTVVPLTDIGEKGIEESLLLVKESHKEERKERGSLLIEAYISSAAPKISLTEARRNYDALLARLVYHHIKTASNNNKEENFILPWHGKLAPEALAVLAQHAIVFGLKPFMQDLSWWIVGARVSSADSGWQLNQLKLVQKHLSCGLYDVTDFEDLAESFSVWIDFSLHKLRHLKTNFPITSGIIAKHELSSLLEIFITMDSDKYTNSILERKEIKDIRTQVEDSVAAYAKLWWTGLVEAQLKGEMKPELQIQKVIVLTNESYHFLSDIAAFYSPTLLRDMKIAYFREMFLMITKKLNACVRPALMNVYNYFDYVVEAPVKSGVNGETKKPIFSLEDGTILWQLYINLGRISKLGMDLPLDVRNESGIYEYHKWFNKGVRRWVELARRRALDMIEKAVELDNFEPVDQYCNFSSSATDVSGIFTDVEIWWRKLEWPDPENSMVLLAKILEDVCSYAMKYADLLKSKVEDMFSHQRQSEQQLALSKQICTGLNNIERIRDEIVRLPKMFEVESLLLKVRNSEAGGVDVALRFNSNIEVLIESSSESLEGKVVDFIEAVLEKMNFGLQNAVTEACETSLEKPLLDSCLDPALHLLREKLSDSNFKRFLQRLWELVIELLHRAVSQNTGKRKASYFDGVYRILASSLSFFTPSDGFGINRDEAKSQEYLNLLELLECLRLPSANLISKYYSERFEEQNLLNNTSRGQLVVRALFTKAGKLIVEVIMAKDMQLYLETGSSVSKNSQFSFQTQPIDSYVKVQLVPFDWFPQFHEFRTKIMKNSDPAVFEETFEMELGNEDDGVSSGFLLFTLKNYHLGRPNTFIGESLLPLKNLPWVDSSHVHQVQNTYLKVTQPGMECGYPSIRALKLRTGDRVATGFIKKINSRLVGGRQKLGPGTISSDDEKPRSRSPRLLHKIGLS